MSAYGFWAVVLVVLWLTLLPLAFYSHMRIEERRSEIERALAFEREFFDYMGVWKMLESVDVRIAREGGKIPVRHYPDDAGADLYALLDAPVTLRPGEKKLIGTGVAVSTPAGWVADIRPRSGLAHKFHVSIVNSPGTVDAGYTGELFVNLENRGVEPVEVFSGDAIAQLVFLPVALPGFRLVESFLPTARGVRGHGSTS